MGVQKVYNLRTKKTNATHKMVAGCFTESMKKNNKVIFRIYAKK
jgi:hypothetical protein